MAKEGRGVKQWPKKKKKMYKGFQAVKYYGPSLGRGRERDHGAL